MPTIVMTHGAFCAGWAFEAFRVPFEARGWTVLTPDLPGHGKDGSVAGLSMSDYATALVRLCENLPERLAQVVRGDDHTPHETPECPWWMR